METLVPQLWIRTFLRFSRKIREYFTFLDWELIYPPPSLLFCCHCAITEKYVFSFENGKWNVKLPKSWKIDKNNQYLLELRTRSGKKQKKLQETGEEKAKNQSVRMVNNVYEHVILNIIRIKY